MTDLGASVGLVTRRDHDGDPVTDAIVRAIAGPLVAAGMRFVTRAVLSEEEELRTYRLWARVGGVAGVILLGVADGDSRAELLQQIDMPFVALALTSREVSYPVVTIDAAAASASLSVFLSSHPARRWVYVTGHQVSEPFGEPEVDLGSDAEPDRSSALVDRAIEVVRTEDVVGDAARIGQEASAPTVLVVDDDDDAVAVLAELEERGISVPEEVALVCWTDSLVCQSASRPITAIDRRGREIGAMLGGAAIAAIHDDTFRAVAAPGPVVVVRETT